MDLKFVVWGIGNRGSALTNAIGSSRIIAYIDSDTSKQGSLFNDIPVISLEQYKERYFEYFIIVTPTYCEKEILEELKNNNILNYFRLRQMPSEFQGYGNVDIDAYLKNTIDPSEKYIIYGDSAYSLLVYGITREICDENVRICLGNGNESFHDVIRKTFFLDEASESELRESKRKVLLTVRTDKFTGSDIASTDLFDLSDLINRYYHEEMNAFHHKHEGERCFIVATGPSLKMDDLKTLRENGQKCIGMNRIFNIDPNFWTPDYYVMTDRVGIEENWEQISNYNVPFKFLNEGIKNDRVNVGEIIKMHVVSGDDYQALPRFSENMEQKVYAHATVTYVAIQLAVYMGFNEIYLTGVDCNYVKGSKSNYFFKESKEDEKDHKVDKMIECYLSAKEYADGHGIRILNATRGGMLDVFPRVDFDSLF